MMLTDSYNFSYQAPKTDGNFTVPLININLVENSRNPCDRRCTRLCGKHAIAKPTINDKDAFLFLLLDIKQYQTTAKSNFNQLQSATRKLTTLESLAALG